MIEINLLPEDLKQKKERQIFLLQLFLCILPVAFGLLIIIHLYLGGLLLFKTLQYKSMNKKWEQLSSQRQKVDEWKKQYKISSQETEQVNKLLAQRIAISDKMQVLACALPRGIWFNHLSLKEKGFYLEGSVVSLKKDQMRLLNLFLGRLKKDKIFFKDFIRLELGHISMRTLGGFSIMDFVLEGDLK
ncbi:MAG: hypothetical protein ISS44_01315 [Candidatus Omnitrophica bacterium]|nr:hypothetical protein [Candidatus Omnitrophota bacterium]